MRARSAQAWWGVKRAYVRIGSGLEDLEIVIGEFESYPAIWLDCFPGHCEKTVDIGIAGVWCVNFSFSRSGVENNLENWLYLGEPRKGTPPCSLTEDDFTKVPASLITLRYHSSKIKEKTANQAVYPKYSCCVSRVYPSYVPCIFTSQQ